MVQITANGNTYDFTIGADPEFFVSQGGKPVSAWGLIPGDKKDPYKVPYGAVQVDGMALEFNINPAKGEAGFLRNLDAVMHQIMDMVPGYEYYDRPVAEFGKEYIDQQHPDAKRLGCEPDFNAYTGDVNPTPDADTPFRTASGHVHIGWTNGVDPMDPGHFEACRVLTKALDVFLGVPSLYWDDDVKRRQLYGKAGAFRPKPYGMEYRTLSNRWLRPDLPYLRKLIFGNVVEAIQAAFNNDEVGEVSLLGKTAKEIIDSNDLASAISAGKYSGVFKTPQHYRELAESRP